MYHYVITLQWPSHGGFVTRTVAGVTDCSGWTRSEIFTALRERETAVSGMPRGPNVLFFSLEPETL